MSTTPPDDNCSPSKQVDDQNRDTLDLDDFTYDLPAELIAQEPLSVRHTSRLLRIWREPGDISHHKFSDLPDLLSPGDLLVVNDTRVIPARLLAHRSTGGQVQILLLRPEANSPNLWHAMATPLRKLKIGEVLVLEPAGEDAPSIRIENIILSDDGQKRLLVDLGPAAGVHALLSRKGFAPLPPYIERDGDPEHRTSDLERYQTVFARAPGAVAAPTAGLHFSDQLIEQLKEKDIKVCSVTLHVGPGTFKPITTSVAEHTVETEMFSIPEETAELVNQALAEKRRVIAVGTTSCRALETAGAGGHLRPQQSVPTSLYIKPGYRFNVISGMVTNFHLSRSSLLVLVSTFAGHELTMRAYKEAIAQRYRFYSYGDAMLIL